MTHNYLSQATISSTSSKAQPNPIPKTVNKDHSECCDSHVQPSLYKISPTVRKRLSSLHIKYMLLPSTKRNTQFPKQRHTTKHHPENVLRDPTNIHWLHMSQTAAPTLLIYSSVPTSINWELSLVLIPNKEDEALFSMCA